jgi:predicted amidohydrolase YtcJ
VTGPAPRIRYRGGVIHTPTGPEATAMTTTGDRIDWVGVDSAAPDDVDATVELDGALVTPAFVDAHAHVTQTGISLRSVDLQHVVGARAFLDALASFAAREPSGPVLGHGWDETTWDDRALPTRAQIDRAVGPRSAYLTRVDGHGALVSSALATALPDLDGRDGWSSDGIVTRDAHHRVRSAVHDMIPADVRGEAVRAAVRLAASRGIGVVHDLRAPHISAPGEAEIVAAALAGADAPTVIGYWGELAPAACPDWSLGLAGDLCIDGSVGSHTAALRAPYEDEATTGHRYLDADEIATHLVACTRRGVQGGFHVIGDAAVDAAIDGLRRAAAVVGPTELARARHRLEHVEMADPEAVATLARYGVVASVQPAFDAAWGGPDQMYATRLGPQRSARMNAFASMQRAGVILAFGSDTPVTPFDPWAGVRAAVLHHDPDQRLTPATAFEAHTRGGHRAARDDTAGTIEPGAIATFAVWEVPAGLARDAGAPLPQLAAEVPLPRCRRTVVDGRMIFTEEDAA